MLYPFGSQLSGRLIVYGEADYTGSFRIAPGGQRPMSWVQPLMRLSDDVLKLKAEKSKTLEVSEKEFQFRIKC